ncbi:MAG: hypothetical protein ABJF11_13795 [Reichenbachiella sp.]|uniref:hypothetical protein n=1 Tax=Reichenbachiella sp. TaxID=2184521 RepID=UPI003264A87E
MKIILITFFLVLAQISYSQVSNDTFQKALLSFDTNFKEIKQISEDTYAVGQEVEAEHPTDPDLLRTVTLNYILQNKGDHYIITTIFPPVVSTLYEDLISSEKYGLEDILKHHFGEDSFIKIEKGEKSKPIASVKVVFKASKPFGIMGNMVKNGNKMTKAYIGLVAQHKKLFLKTKKQNLKQPLSRLDNEWFPYYAEDESLFDFVEEPDIDGAIGHWVYASNKLELSYDLYNFSDRFEMYITGYVESEENAKAYLTYFEEFTAGKGKYPGASNTEASLRPSDKTYVGVKVTYQYDGSMNLEDFIESYTDNYFKYGSKMNKVY